MSHELEVINGEAQMAYVGEVPWHGLGFKVDPDLTPAEFMVMAGLDWTVDLEDSYVTHNGNKVPTGQKALVRSLDSKVLTNVGKGWNSVQNAEAFDFFDEYVKAGDMEMHTAGSLKGGQLVWALAKTKESFELFRGDLTENYFLFTNPHQYGKTINIRMTPVRVVCQNTLTLSLNSKSSSELTVNHRKQWDAASVKEQMGIAREKMGHYKEMAEFLGKKRYTRKDLVAYMNQVFGNPSDEKDYENEKVNSRLASKALEVVHTQPGAEFAEGTWWQAFNAITYMTDHLQGRTADGRLESAWYGKNRKVKLSALETALDYAEAA